MSLDEQKDLKRQIRRLKRESNRLRVRRRFLKRKISHLGARLDKLKTEDSQRNGFSPYKEDAPHAP